MSSVSCGPLAARRFHCLFLIRVFSLPNSFLQRTVSLSSSTRGLADWSLLLRLQTPFRPVLSSAILAYVRLLACWHWLPRDVHKSEVHKSPFTLTAL